MATKEKLIVGPILHLRRGDDRIWRFTVSVLIRSDSNESPYALSTDGGANAAIVGPYIAAMPLPDFRLWQWRIESNREIAATSLAYSLQPRAGDSNLPASTHSVAVPARGNPPTLAFFSCNGVQFDVDYQKLAKPQAMWERLARLHQGNGEPQDKQSAGPYHVMIGGGDQIYADMIFRKLPELEDFEHLSADAKISKTLPAGFHQKAVAYYFEELYGLRWSSGDLASCLASIPSVFTWDDHDIFDGWGSYSEALQSCACFQAVYRAARVAFLTLQIGGHPEVACDPEAQQYGSIQDWTSAFLLQHVPLGTGLDLVLLDLRSERSLLQAMSEAQWTCLSSLLKSFVQARQPDSRPHLLLVSSISTIFGNFDIAEKFFRLLPGRQDYEDDLADQWESRYHIGERSRLFHRLLEFAKEAFTRVTILSGDIHVGLHGQIVSRLPKHCVGSESETSIHQVTSSAIVYPPPGLFAMAGLKTLLSEDPRPVSSGVATEILSLPGRIKILGERNWLLVRPESPNAGGRLWLQWIMEKSWTGEQLVIHPRA